MYSIPFIRPLDIFSLWFWFKFQMKIDSMLFIQNFFRLSHKYNFGYENMGVS